MSLPSLRRFWGSDAARVGCVLLFGAKPAGSRLHPPRVPSFGLSPGLQLSVNQRSDSPWLGPRPWQPSVQQSSCGLGLHIRFELCGISASAGFHPGCAESRFRGSRQPVCLLRVSRLRACVLFACSCVVSLCVLSLSVLWVLRVPCFCVYMSFLCLSRISLCIPALLTALLRYNLHSMQITRLMCTVQWIFIKRTEPCNYCVSVLSLV